MSDEVYHRVGSRIWHEDWGDDAKFVALYLLTNEHRSTEGIYRLPLAYGATDMGWPMKRFKQAFEVLLSCDFIEFDPAAHVVLIVKALAWQQPANPNQRKSAVKKLRALPPTILLKRFETLVETHAPEFSQWIGEHFPQLFIEPFEKPLAKAVRS